MFQSWKLVFSFGNFCVIVLTFVFYFSNMTHTLQELKSGTLKGLKQLKIAEGLTEFPREIFSLADTLEVLDLSDNHLASIPDEIIQLKHLRILFFANNQFKVFPKILAQCSSLSMIGFKSNQIDTVPENAFPPRLRWLVLTNNKIAQLPKSIGACPLLQKCALAGNLLTELPAAMSECKNLELLRVSANQLKEIPAWLFELPKLSWVAFGGNPAAHSIQVDADLESFDWNDFEVKELLGEGASGLISRAHWDSKQKDVAIKVFKGAVTSDGLPEDEMAFSIAAGNHENLVKVLGKIKGHPSKKNGLILKLITSDFENLGNPPSLITCTRDTFEKGTQFTFAEAHTIANGIASVGAQLHSKGINHGDLYAHNIMINKQTKVILGDFGAASAYVVDSDVSHLIERVEVRAFGCLMEDMTRLAANSGWSPIQEKRWNELLAACFNAEVKTRPCFRQIVDELVKW